MKKRESVMNLYERISESVNLVDYITTYTNLQLEKAGREYRALCPFHEETVPSFYVSPVKNLWYCFGCNNGGGIIQFVSLYKNIPVYEAVKFLAETYGISIKEELLKQVKEAEKEREALGKILSKARDRLEKESKGKAYLKERGLSEKTIKEFGLGYSAKNNAIIIPIHDVYGRMCGWAMRKLTGEPKYLNSTNGTLYNKSSVLFNLNRALPYARDALYIVEGYFDVMAVYQAGFKNVAAIGGSMLTRQQARILHRFLEDSEIVLVPDADEAGMKAAERNIELLKEMDLAVNVVQLPCKDCAELLKEKGEGSLKEYLSSKKVNAYLFLTKRIIETTQDKELQYVKVKRFLRKANIENPLVVDDVIKSYLSKVWKKDSGLIREYITGRGFESISLAKVRTLPSMIDDYIVSLREGAGFHIGTGYPTVDRVFRGLYPSRSDIMTILAFTGAGKTALALNIVNNIAKENPDLPMVFFSLELDYEEILERLAQIACGVTQEKVQEAFEKRNDLYNDICVTLSDRFSNLRVIDEGNLKVEDMDAITKEISLKEFDEPTKLVFIDHLDYINVPGLSGNERVDQMMRDLKAMAKKQKLAVILLHQISRSSVNRDPGAPVPLSAGKWSGNVENTSSFVFTMYRPALSENLSAEEKERMKNYLGIEIKKSRRTAITTGPIEFFFDQKTLRIFEHPWEKKEGSARDFNPYL